jgi:FkbM family methyltransferase
MKPESLAQIIRDATANTARSTPNFKGRRALLQTLDGLLNPKRKVVVREINGVTYELQTEDLIDFRLYYFGRNEANVFTYLQNAIASKNVVLWDVGANVGSVSLPLLQACPNLFIYAFEPSPKNVVRLRRNIELNPHLSERITVVPQALSDCSGDIQFFPSAEPRNSGAGSLCKTHETTAEPVTVSAVTGDELIKEGAVRSPHFVKIDVEGFEYEVLAGLKNRLSREDLTIVFEHSLPRLRQRLADENRIFDFLSDHGFSARVIDSESSHDDGVADFVATKS